MRLFEELKRRNVFRTGAVYIAVSWLLIQVAVALETAIGLPSWFDGVVFGLLAIGFPLALVFAWAFEITPDGLKHSHEVSPVASAIAGRRLDFMFIGAATLAIFVVGIDWLAHDHGAESALASPESAENRVSIAVLPFIDLSPEGDQEYFVDGLSEELLNVLAHSPDLKVAGRTSSFAFKDQNRDVREIGKILDVTHILEGSVRKSGEQIRVTAQLIDARDGYHVFSETYDRTLQEIFAVQDDIAEKIGSALKARLIDNAAAKAAPIRFEAYDLYLLARQRVYTRDPRQMRKANELLASALALDPDYAPALAQKAILALLMSDVASSYGDTPLAEAKARAHAYIDRALAASPNLAEAHAALGLLRLIDGAPLKQVEAPLQRALEINPSLNDARNWLAIALEWNGRPLEALAIHEAIVARDPLFRPSFNNLTSRYSMRRQFHKAEALIARVERIVGENNDYTLHARGTLALDKGELAEAVRRFRAAYEPGAPDNALRVNYATALIQIGDLKTALAVATPAVRPQILRLMGRRDEAAAEIEALPLPASGQVEILAPVLAHFIAAGRYENAARYIEVHFGDVRTAAAGDISSTPDWAGFLALAYKALGREDAFQDTVRLIAEAVEKERLAGDDSHLYWINRAEIAALRGDNDSAVQNLQAAAERNYVSAFGFYSPIFDDLRDDTRFRAIEARLRARAETERERLGLSNAQSAPDRHRREAVDKINDARMNQYTD